MQSNKMGKINESFREQLEPMEPLLVLMGVFTSTLFQTNRPLQNFRSMKPKITNGCSPF